MTRILILCSGNSCRSQMVEGFLRYFDAQLYVRSAGTNPSGQIHPKAVQVMAELGIDISEGQPDHIDKYLDEEWDYVITVCDNAKEMCPIFMGKVKNQ
jgi:arsenate reductase